MCKISSIKFHKLLKSTIRPNSNILYWGKVNTSFLRLFRPKLAVNLHEELRTTGKSKNLRFLKSFEELGKGFVFDYVILDEVLPYMDDVYSTLKRLRVICKDEGKLIVSSIPKANLFRSAARLMSKSKKKLANWIPEKLFHTLLYLSNFWPRPKIQDMIIADATEEKRKRKYSYSIIIPTYNEEGNIAKCIARVPDLKRDYEIVVVNDGSKDKTAEVVRDIMKKNKKVRFIDYRKNMGKGYATKVGLDAAKKDVLMILDADMTVRPEDLPLFIEPFESQNAEFVNGTRMVYPLADQAMRTINIIGNMIFSKIFSYLLNQDITDTLCGTKCLFRRDYQRVEMKDDAWPDFDMLFGAAKLNLKIAEMPIHYQTRVAGESNMKSFKHGWMLLKASIKGFKELKLN